MKPNAIISQVDATKQKSKIVKPTKQTIKPQLKTNKTEEKKVPSTNPLKLNSFKIFSELVNLKNLRISNMTLDYDNGIFIRLILI